MDYCKVPYDTVEVNPLSKAQLSFTKGNFRNNIEKTRAYYLCNEPYVSKKQPIISVKEPNIPAKEPYIPAEEPASLENAQYISAKSTQAL